MHTETHRYQQFKAYRRFNWVCPDCKKTRVKSIMEYVTINPWNPVTPEKANEQAQTRADSAVTEFLADTGACSPCR